MIHVHKKKKAQLKKQTTRKQRMPRIEKKENDTYQFKNHISLKNVASSR